MQGKRVIKQIRIANSYDVSYRSRVFSAISYASATMEDIGFADVTANTSRTGISEVEFKYFYSLFQKRGIGMELGSVARASGDNKGGDTFVALNDGQTKYDLHIDLSWGLSRHISIFFENRHTYRAGDLLKDQWMSLLSLGIRPMRKLYFTASYGFLQTFGGPDIGGAGFGNADGSPGFSRVKENYRNLMLSAEYLLKKYSFNISYAKKLDGRNTDQSKLISLGFALHY